MADRNTIAVDVQLDRPSLASAPSRPPQAESEPFRGRIPQLDGLRAIAISLVLCHHFWPTKGVLAPFAKIAQLGWIGVDLFFVISGFLICGILLDTRGSHSYFRNFLARRALRIFPLYYVFLTAMAIGIPILQHSHEFLAQSGSMWWYYLYSGNIREAITGHEPAYVLAPLWSLSIEEQFYISFPLIVWLLGSRRLWKFLCVLLIAAPISRLLAFFLWPDNARIQYLATPCRMDAIALGCIIATGFRLGTINLSKRTSAVLAGGAIALVALVFFLGGLDRLQPFCRIAGYSVTALGFSAVVTWAVIARPRWLAVGPLINLGQISYGLYLLQRPAEVILGKLLSRTHLNLGPSTLFAAKIAFAIFLAMASWNLFEKHVLRLKERFSAEKGLMKA